MEISRRKKEKVKEKGKQKGKEKVQENKKEAVYFMSVVFPVEYCPTSSTEGFPVKSAS